MSVEWHGDEILGRVREAALRGVYHGASIVDTVAVGLILHTPKTGKVYRRGGVLHQASAAGEAPASDTGALVNRRRIDIVPDQLTAKVVFNAEHALYLQYGTEHMEPRPFADLALQHSRAAVKQVIEDEIRGAL